ncbi:MAG: sterol desaturase family protein [Cyclobacteriaceae bacterium]
MAKHFVSDKDECVRMFKSGFMEMFSKVHFSIPLILYIPLIAYLLYQSIAIHEISAFSIIGYFILGIAVWSATEYFLHRFVFHYHPTSKWGQRLHFVMHGVHHDYPNDSLRLVMPPSVSIPLAFLFYFLFKAIMGPVFVFPLFAGFVLGYLFYDISHYAIHHFKIDNKIWAILKEHHMRHHYVDPDHGYGVSSTLWDHVMGTMFKSSKKQKVNS